MHQNEQNVDSDEDDDDDDDVRSLERGDVDAAVHVINILLLLLCRRIQILIEVCSMIWHLLHQCIGVLDSHIYRLSLSV